MNIKYLAATLSLAATSLAICGFVRDEMRAKDNSIIVGDIRYEIDGVCKFTDSSALCWKPDGSPHSDLTKKLENAVQRLAQRQGQSYSLTYLKKKRVLIMKQMMLGQNYSSGNGHVYNVRSTNDNKVEGWSEYSNSNFSASERGFDGSQIEWKSIEGTFELSTKEFQLRYEFPSPTNQTTKGTLRDLAPGRFEVDGNVFEIVSIADHKDDPQSRSIVYTGSSDSRIVQPTVKTDVIIKPISIVNPFSSMSFQLADENGNPIQYVDEKDNPVAMSDVQKWSNVNNRSSGGAASPYHYAGGFHFDPKNYPPTGLPTLPGSFFVAKEKCTRILITSQKREVYTFDHIRLDPR